MEPRKQTLPSDQLTEEYFDQLLLESRHIGSVTPDLTFEVFGRTFATPVTTAALSHLKGKDGDGMVQMVQGAREAGALSFVGMSSLEQYAGIGATGAPIVRIIKPYADEKEIFARIEQAEELGAVAVGMDVSHIFNSAGQPDLVLGLPMGPKTFQDVERYCKRTKLPFVFKDVISPWEARQCLDAGAGGILISHHHGILGSAIPALMALPEILKVVKDRVPVFVDGSFSNGTDVLKALALGASAVCIGRALMEPVREEGSAGARRVLEEITAELSGAMARTGSASLDKIDPAILWNRATGKPFQP